MLIEVTRVISWILIINALGIIPRTIFIINVDFKVQTKASLISSLVSGIVGISMALFGLGVWSLVGQQLSRQLLNTFFLCFIVVGVLLGNFQLRVSKKCSVLALNC